MIAMSSRFDGTSFVGGTLFFKFKKTNFQFWSEVFFTQVENFNAIFIPDYFNIIYNTNVTSIFVTKVFN